MPRPIGRRQNVEAPEVQDTPKKPRAGANQPAPQAPGDGFAAGEAAPAEAAAANPASVKGPFAALAKRGDFNGFVKTASGADVYVSVKLAKNAATNRPMVLLDGVAARYDRNSAFEKLVTSRDQSIISVFLPGQGETLAKDMEKGGRSIRRDIEQEQQAKTVVEVLDALGVKDPVGVLGLSYGGAIAAQVEKQYPDRFNKVMLVAPYVKSEGKSSPYYNMMMNNPWNPWGPSMYRAAAKSTLEKTFNYEPEVLQKFPGAFHEGLLRLSMGLEDFELADVVKGMEDVHWLVVPGDGASDPNQNAEAFKGAKTGSFVMAPNTDAGKHDLIRGDGALVATWAADVMAGRWKTQDVPELVKQVEKELKKGAQQ